MTTAPASRYRLPTHTVPSRYDVELSPDFGQATFDGSVTIEVLTSQDNPQVSLNAADLNIHRCTVDGDEVGYSLDDEYEVLTLDAHVSVGSHVICIDFTGVLNDELRGWYRSTFVDENGNEQTIATSQMQATDCRRAFPCWDEPEFKAVFGIALTIDDGLLAISNGKEAERTAVGDGRSRVVFADTISMSSYLVAVVVGPLTATDWIDVDGVPMRIVHVPGKEHLTEFGLEVGAFGLRWFQEYYGIDYPGDKVELVALPDFAAGAMENLGCITFRESLLLVDPATATQAEQQLVADVVCHELAHMWFGDLVTMKWWNGIWLNEAFATFMELAAANAFRPEWERWNSFALERSSAFETDSLASTRPVEFHVESPADAEAMFDILTYIKGGALLRMLELHLGPENFREGVSRYLERHALGSTETSDLWDAIEESTGQPVRSMMDTWIWQPGYPLISADLDDQAQLAISQTRFRFDPTVTPDDSRWSIPVGIRVGENTIHTVLDGDSMSLPVDGYDDSPIVVNADGAGFFRVNYSDALLSRFDRDGLAAMSTIERYNLIDDQWNTVLAGRSHVGAYLVLIDAFVDEPSLDVWRRVTANLATLHRWLLDSPTELDAFRSRVIQLISPTIARLGEPRPGEPDLSASLRGVLLRAASLVGHDAASIERAGDIYREWEREPSAVDAELAAAATSVMAAFGDASRYDNFLQRALDTTTPQVQLRHLHALARFEAEELMRRTCDLAFSDNVKSQNAPFLLRDCIDHARYGRTAFEIVTARWDEANERFPRNAIVRMVSSVSQLDTHDDISAAESFFAAHPVEQGAATLAQILERQRVNAEVRARELPGLLSFLAR